MLRCKFEINDAFLVEGRKPPQFEKTFGFYCFTVDWLVVVTPFRTPYNFLYGVLAFINFDFKSCNSRSKNCSFLIVSQTEPEINLLFHI